MGLISDADYEPIQTVTPHITQALYTAGLAFVHEIHNSAWDFTREVVQGESLAPSNNLKHAAGSEAFFAHIAQQNLDVILKSLKTLETFWAGAGVSLYVLKQRAQGTRFHPCRRIELRLNIQV